MNEKLWNRNYLRAWGANFSLFFAFMLIVPLLPIYLKEEYGASKDVIGVVLSGYTVVALLTRATSGYLVDKYPRKQILVLGFVLLTAFFAGYLAAGSLLLFACIRTLHGFPFGISTVANSTVAVDVLHPSRRAEGIGYYGLSNNVATAISPSVGLWLYQATGDFNLLFLTSMAVSLLGVWCAATIRTDEVEAQPTSLSEQSPAKLNHRRHHRSLIDRFYLTKAWREGLAIACYSFAYGVVSTYVAIYGSEELNITSGSGLFFTLLALGLIASRLVGSRTLRQGRVLHNAVLGSVISCAGYLLFALCHNMMGYYGCAILIGLGNGHLWPAFQTIFITIGPAYRRGTANASLLTSWDLGVGLGVFMGGLLSEHWGYHTAFWGAWVIEALGVAFYLLHGVRHYRQSVAVRASSPREGASGDHYPDAGT